MASPHFLFDTLNEALKQKLGKLGLWCDLDLILHLPLRYEDETRLLPIDRLAVEQTAQIEGVVTAHDIQTRPRRQLVCQLQDASGTINIRFFSFYPGQVANWAIGKRLRVLGEVRDGYSGLEIIHPKYRVVQDNTALPTALTPVYSVMAGLAQHTLAKLIPQALTYARQNQSLSEILPQAILKAHRLSGLVESLAFLHHPAAATSLDALQSRTHPAWRRIKFDELLAQQLSMRQHYHQRHSQHAPALPQNPALQQKLLDLLSFELTAAQQKVMTEISRDMAQPFPMQRLLQGDVGSGKTVVAAMAALQSIANGYQVAVMAPTEILAEQHLRKFVDWFAPLGIDIAWLSGSLKKRQREAALQKIEQGIAGLVVGTHALFQSSVQFKHLGVAIIDEQHRFGVNQRLALRLKGDDVTVPHQLMMSATPIPRTLSMSYFADLDVSVIDQLPPGRSPVATKLIDSRRRNEVLARIREACHAGRQAYWVCPLIEESETLQLKTAMETLAVLHETFPELEIALIHGRLDSAEKSAIMTAFSQGTIQLLIATTVIEVGVDVPNASLMVIEHAERMGLSQLHQLRGRIGRGADAGVCILLFQHPLSELARKRLQVIFRHNDGFEIARQDLLLRGPGEFLGTRQSGVPLLRFADLEADGDLLNIARETADILLRDYPQAAQAHLDRWLGRKKDYLRV
ncbi:MAG: ATP-dependent DNA helicase RecG [Nitrosomonas sp.]|nr:ATP-dependent DNA helicase RecG [Nitrosomonas sp.]